MRRDVKYSAEITSHQGGAREFTDEGLFDSLQDAVDYVNRQLIHHSFTARVWLNDREVKVRGRMIVGGDGGPFCTNQAWHDTFATDDYPRIQIANGVAA